MRMSSESKPLSRSKAWFCAVVNQLAFPGLGTIMAGRRIGYLQAAAMLAGFCMATGFIVWFLYGWMLLLADPAMSESRLWAQFWRYAWIGIAGLALTFVVWCWSLLSSIQIVRGAEQPQATGKTTHI